MAYATPADLIVRFDEHLLADLVSDTGHPAADLASHPTLTAALSTASGRINSAVQVAGMYTADDLTALTDDDDAYLTDLTCRLALIWIVQRRPSKDVWEWAKDMQAACDETLELIRSGKNLFNVAAVKEAGQPSVDGLSAVDYKRLNLLPQRTPNFYPNTASRLPVGRG